MSSNRFTFRALYLVASFFCALLCFISCNEETVIDRTGAARITPVLSIDATIENPGGNNFTDGSLDLNPDLFAFSLISESAGYHYDWKSIADYPDNELLPSGTYTATASYNSYYTEGAGRPYYKAVSTFDLGSGAESEVRLTARLESSVFRVKCNSNLTEAFSAVSATIHSQGYSYIATRANDDGYIYVHPGKTDVSLNVTTESGESLSIVVATINNAEARHFYDIDIQSNGASLPVITTHVNGTEAGQITLTPALFAAPAPKVSSRGFTQGSVLKIAEGNSPETSTGFLIDGENIKSVRLTTLAPSLNSLGWPSEIDLATADQATLSFFRSKGMAIEYGTMGKIKYIDMTAVIENLRATQALSEARFSVIAESTTGKLSAPITLDIDIEPVEISITGMSDIILGVNKAELTLISHTANFKDNLRIQAMGRNVVWVDCEIESLTPLGDDEYSVTFTVPQITLSLQEVRVIYCDNIVSSAQLKRVSPEFKIEADAYAMTSRIRILPKDPDMLGVITSLVNIYVDGNKTLSEQRDRDAGIVYIGNLSPDKNYTLKASLMDKPAVTDFTPSLTIHTESPTQVENYNFEDHGEGPQYKNLPRGGRYSQTIVDIFNQQNYTDYKLDEPRYWANTNAKTFCKAATNHNTWYLVPSVFSEVDNVEGTSAVVLQTVAWDTHGEEIEPYRQQSGSYLNYNPNAPHINYKAAGKVFLGSYSFDPATMTETYKEGIPFSSRPVAVNGNYHFTPAPNALSDCGKITVEVLGTVNGSEIIIARNSVSLTPALTYTAFTIPLNYSHFGVKATRLKIMISSSLTTGTIDQETAGIVTYANPVSAVSTGGKLWVQNITLSYF